MLRRSLLLALCVLLFLSGSATHATTSGRPVSELAGDKIRSAAENCQCVTYMVRSLRSKGYVFSNYPVNARDWGSYLVNTLKFRSVAKDKVKAGDIAVFPTFSGGTGHIGYFAGWSSTNGPLVVGSNQDPAWSDWFSVDQNCNIMRTRYSKDASVTFYTKP